MNLMDYKDPAHQIAKIIREENPVIWIGAGLSNLAGLPDTRSIIGVYKSKLPRELYSDEDDLQTITEIFETKFSRAQLIQVLQGLLTTISCDKSYHDAIFSLPQVQDIVTTNYDTLIEEALRGRKTHICYGMEDSLVTSRDNEIRLFKIHGCINKPESIVITKTDYERLRSKGLCSPVYSKLYTLLNERNMLFFGYSLSDLYILELIQLSEPWRDKRIHNIYCIDNKSNKEREKALKRIGIVSITADIRSIYKAISDLVIKDAIHDAERNLLPLKDAIRAIRKEGYETDWINTSSGVAMGAIRPIGSAQLKIQISLSKSTDKKETWRRILTGKEAGEVKLLRSDIDQFHVWAGRIDATSIYGIDYFVVERLPNRKSSVAYRSSKGIEIEFSQEVYDLEKRYLVRLRAENTIIELEFEKSNRTITIKLAVNEGCSARIAYNISEILLCMITGEKFYIKSQPNDDYKECRLVYMDCQIQGEEMIQYLKDTRRIAAMLVELNAEYKKDIHLPKLITNAEVETARRLINVSRTRKEALGQIQLEMSGVVLKEEGLINNEGKRLLATINSGSQESIELFGEHFVLGYPILSVNGALISGFEATNSEIHGEVHMNMTLDPKREEVITTYYDEPSDIATVFVFL